MTAPIGNNFTAGNPNFRDLSRNVHQPYVFKEYPKVLYHPAEKTPQSVIAKQKAETHNSLHPDKPELIPDLIPVTVIVQDEAEEAQMKAKGFSEQAPHPYEGEAPEAPKCDFCGLPKHKGRCKKVVE